MKSFLIKFLRAFGNSLKRFNIHYAQITLKTIVTQNTPDDEKKQYILGDSFLLSKPKNWYSFMLLKQMKNYKENHRYKPFLYMKTGLHEISVFS